MRSLLFSLRALLIFTGGCVIPFAPDARRCVSIDTAPVYLAEITVYDPAIPGTRVLRYASGSGHVTGPTETPADTYYAARMKQPSLMKRDLFNSGTTQGRSRVGFGDLILINDDGDLDGLLNYGFDGRSVTIRRGTRGAAYPSGFTTVLVGTMEQPEFSSQEVRIKLRDRQFSLDVPLQPTKYAGSNVLPAGLEGVSDLKGKPKPVCYGSVSNVPAICVNTSKLIYQVADSACASIDSVYDKGIPLTNAFPLTSRTSTFGANAINAVAYGNGVFVAVGAAGTLASSPDGSTWTSRTSGFAGTNIADVTYGNGLFVAVGGSGKLFTSPDGITWTSRTSTFGATNINAAGYGNGLFVVGGDSGKLATSPDGITWTSRTSGFGALALKSSVYGRQMYVVAGEDGTIASSPDGITWTLRSSGVSGTGVQLWAAAFGNGTFVLGGLTSNNYVTTSPDGITWTARPVGVVNTNYRLAFGNGYFVMVGTSGQTSTSVDGTGWVARTSGFTTTFFGVAYGNNVFVIAGASGGLGTTTPPSNFATLADLQDDTLAPPPGTFKAYPAGGYFRLGSSPAGQVTADVVQGATAADRTAAQVFKSLLTRAGMGGSDYSSADITALDTANSAVIGFWTDQETTFADVIDDVAGSVGAWWGPDNSGLFRIKQLTLPTGTADIELTANDLLKALERVATQDEGKGVPVFRSVIRYAKNYTVQTSDLAAGVSDARRVIVGNEWRESSYTDATVQTSHLLAPEIVEETLLTAEADALAEATRRQAIRGARRDRFIAVLQLNSETETLDLGSIANLTHARYGLSGGKKFRVIGVEPDAKERTLTLNLWG